MELSDALQFSRTHRKSVFVTMRRDGHPQLSNVTHWTGEDEVIRVSITADRAKYHNLKRDPWVALHVTSDDFWSYAVLEGAAELSAIAAVPDDETVEELVAYFRAVNGEHDDWDDYRAAMVRDQRVVARIRPNRVYGSLR
jgi:PPOX class probable F420-dependent enzyme